MSDTITVTGDYGYEQFRLNDSDASVIDATDATWIVANQGSQLNLYPVLIDRSDASPELIGGQVHGTVSLTDEWVDIYQNSSAVMIRDAENATIRDWEITRAWDGIRVAGDVNGFLIDNIIMSDIRDDAIENDYGASGTISNSLFDGVFSGISMTKPDLPDLSSNVVTIDNVLIRMESYLFRGNETHQSPFKITEESPSLRITDTVIAIDNVDHVGDWRLDLAWEKTIESDNNTFLNLSGDPFPAGYPLPGDGWTILQGQEAWDFWDAARANFLDNYEYTGDEQPVEEPVDAPVEDPVAETPSEPEIEPETVAPQAPAPDEEASGPEIDTSSDDEIEVVSEKKGGGRGLLNKIVEFFERIFGGGRDKDDIETDTKETKIPNGQLKAIVDLPTIDIADLDDPEQDSENRSDEEEQELELI